MATTMVNGTASSETNSSNPTMANVGRKQSKPDAGNKTLDTRKQAGNFGDGAQRRNPTQKAWTSGMNPITQRSTTPAQQNGTSSQPKSSPQKNMNNKETNTPDRHANDRLLFLLGNLMGLTASITVKNGDVFSGVFVGSIVENHESAYLLKMVQHVKSEEKCEANGIQECTGDYIGVGEDHAMSFDIKEVVDLAVEGVAFDARDKPQNGSVGGFRTDADISGNLALRERDLQRWEPSTETDVDLSLEHSGGTWDQFEANAQLFGVTSNYDENIYTTRIDRTDPKYRQKEAEAERIAQEIEGTTASNSYVREERGMAGQDDEGDEEDKYSGVRRQGLEYPPLQSSQNKYTPPARRPPTGKATVAGAPVDPAIISSQIARPNSKSEEQTEVVPNKVEAASDTAITKESSQREQIREAAKVLSPSKEPIPSTLRPASTTKAPTSGSSATENVETELLDSFRQFANMEKMKLHDHRRHRVSQDKAIKLNDLMKFSKNFKLMTPVPKDLVPILAKDKSKQEEIMEKAQRNAQHVSSTPPKSATTVPDQKTPRTFAAARYEDNPASPTAVERQSYQRGRQGYPPQGPQASQSSKDRQQQGNNAPVESSKPGQGLFSHRLADSHRQHKAGIPVSVPNPLPIQNPRNLPSRPVANPLPMTSPQASSHIRTPTSATSARFNANAMAFRPNPAANTFKPTGEHSDDSSPGTHTRAPSPSAFFGDRKPLSASERQLITDHFNPLKWLKNEAETEGKTKDYAFNGGIKPAYKTPPTWNPPKEDEDFKSYKDMFEVPPPVTNSVSPSQSSPAPPQLPHQHQLPLHLQSGSHGVAHVHAPHQTPYQMQPQPPPYPSAQHHYEDHHRMHLSASSSSVYPSPRLQNTNMAYPSPMPQPAQLTYQAMPHYVVGPTGPHPAHFRQFQGGPQMIATQAHQMAAPMMVPQYSNGGFIGAPHGIAVPFNPQIPMYPPGDPPPPYGAPSQPPSGYPSPGRGAPMMMHQGSHQGQHSQMYMNPGQFGQPVYAQQPPPHMTPMRGYGSPQPHYNHSPQQQYHYPSQPHRVPNNNYSQLPPGPHQHMAGQHPPPPPSQMEGGKEAK
ncbi:hypothetical protein MMC12_005779 [Toensbergia leucococca]|nr:hypothetical protein [Toensbergia leucococca]